MLTKQEKELLQEYCEKDKSLATLLDRIQTDHQMELSQISHELRNPITIINSFLQLTETSYPEVITFHTWNPVMENMAYLKQLLNDFSTYQSSLTLHKKSDSLSKLLSTLVDSCRYNISPHQITFEQTTPIPSAYFDSTKLRSLFLNLIRNAVEAFPPDRTGHINLSLSYQEPNFLISVKNDGPQIPPQFLSSLFDPFVTHKKDGTGLGLAIVKNIIEAHQGTISVDSTPAETCFFLTLPRLLQ